MSSLPDVATIFASLAGICISIGVLWKYIVVPLGKLANYLEVFVQLVAPSDPEDPSSSPLISAVATKALATALNSEQAATIAAYEAKKNSVQNTFTQALIEGHSIHDTQCHIAFAKWTENFAPWGFEPLVIPDSPPEPAPPVFDDPPIFHDYSGGLTDKMLFGSVD